MVERGRGREEKMEVEGGREEEASREVEKVEKEGVEEKKG